MRAFQKLPKCRRRINLGQWRRRDGRGGTRVCCRTRSEGQLDRLDADSSRAEMYRQNRGPLVPTLSVAFRMLWLIRSIGAMYSIISDCDEGISLSRDDRHVLMIQSLTSGNLFITSTIILAFRHGSFHPNSRLGVGRT